MAGNLRPELSKKNKYWIDKNRFYELKYFCLQYPLWKKSYEQLDALRTSSFSLVRTNDGSIRDYVALCAEERTIYLNRMCTIEKAARDADSYLASYILKAVTEGLSYSYLKARLEIPCSRDMYYDRYRRFFWLLDQTKN